MLFVVCLVGLLAAVLCGMICLVFYLVTVDWFMVVFGSCMLIVLLVFVLSGCGCVVVVVFGWTVADLLKCGWVV